VKYGNYFGGYPVSQKPLIDPKWAKDGIFVFRTNAVPPYNMELWGDDYYD
jgi:hypothetical protein